MALTKRQRRQALKSDFLDALHQHVLNADCDPTYGLSPEEVAEVHAELARQLYTWAARIKVPRELLLWED